MVTFSAQLGCAFVRSLTLWSLSCSDGLSLLLSGHLPCCHFQCTAGLSAFVRSLTLWSLSVHTWTLLLPGHLPCSHFQCTAESGKPCDDCQCFCRVTHPVVIFSAQLSQVNCVMTVTASVTHLPWGHSNCTAGRKKVVHQIFTH